MHSVTRNRRHLGLDIIDILQRKFKIQNELNLIIQFGIRFGFRIFKFGFPIGSACSKKRDEFVFEFRNLEFGLWNFPFWEIFNFPKGV